jgi:RTX calcium-binding nonapeptide repeat (4 copies)
MATLIVTNLNDAGAGSLRAAVATANASVGVADTIVFAGGLAGGTVTLTTGELALTGDVTIDGDTTGDNKADITISGNNASKIFNETGSGTDVILLSLNLTSGFSQYGGAIRAQTTNGTLSIFDSTISNSQSYFGGGIDSINTALTLTNSLVSGNSAIGTGSFGNAGGILSSGGTTTLVNSTVTGNSATSMGGGLYSGYGSKLSLVNSTVTDNSAPTGSGIVLRQPGATTITNSVVMGTVGSVGYGNPVFAITTADHSVFETAVVITNNIGSLTNVANVGLGALGDHGGTTFTRDIVSPTSVLVDKGSNSAAAGILTDADGNVRVSSGTVDIGATEYSVLTVTNLNDSGAGSLRDAVAQANAKVGADHIVFQAGLSGTILTASTLVLSNDVTINGDTTGEGDPDIIIGSDGSMHLGLQVNAGTEVGLASLGLNGFTTLSGASAIENHGILTITYSNITNNTVTGGGTQLGLSGETIFSDNNLRIRQSVLSGNHQTGQNAAAVSGVYGAVVNGNVGGNAASILYSGSGTNYVFSSAIINEVSVGGTGSNGANTFAYNPTSGGNGGNGGRAVVGILNFNGGSSSFGINGVNTVTGGAAGSGGMGSVGNGYGAVGQNGVIGATAIGVLSVNSGGGFLNPGATAGDQNANTLTGVMYGLGGNDIMYSNGVVGVLDGGSGHDTLFGILKNSFYVKGGLGNDLLRLSDLAPLESYSNWDGGFGVDTLDLSLDHFLNSSGVTLNLATGANSLNMIVNSIENIVGTSTGNDTLTGSAGNNTIQGLGGFDILDGGAGNDTLDYSEKTGAVTLALNGSTAVFQKLNGVNEDTVFNFENITGGTGADVLTGDGFANVLHGGANNDTLNGGLGSDFIFGDAGQDVILFGNGLAGDIDNINGGAERDLLDMSSTTNGAVWIDFGYNVISGPNMVTGTNLFTAAGEARVVQMDSMIGTGFNDTLRGDAGSNFIDGGAGDDQLLSYSPYDTVTPYSSLGDVIMGGAGNDLLFSGTGNDYLDGGANNDVIEVGAGTDTVVTGTGNDTVFFSPNCGTDTVTDFTGGPGVVDVLRLYGFGSAFDTAAEVKAVASQHGLDTWITLPGTTIILQNITATNLANDDFVFV